MDIVKYNFGLPPYDLQKFYVIHLGQPILEQFFQINMDITIETLNKMNILNSGSEAKNFRHEPSNRWQSSADRDKFLAEALQKQTQAASDNSTNNTIPPDNIQPIALRPILGRKWKESEMEN